MGNSSLGVEGSATAAESVFVADAAKGGDAAGAVSFVIFGGRRGGGLCRSLGEGASPPFWTGGFGAPIGVPSGRKETVRTGFGSGNSDVMVGGGAAAGGTSGVLMVAATGVAIDAPSAGLGWSAVGEGLGNGKSGLSGDAWALKSTGCSSELTILTDPGFALSLRKRRRGHWTR